MGQIKHDRKYQKEEVFPGMEIKVFILGRMVMEGG